MYQKLMIQGQIEVLTGLHIGASDVYAAIGAANSPVVRDPKTQYPIIPGSSLKGKIRTLLVRDAVEGYVLPEPKDDPPPIARLFGKPASSAENKGGGFPASIYGLLPGQCRRVDGHRLYRGQNGKQH